jgi:hypothetical protein
MLGKRVAAPYIENPRPRTRWMALASPQATTQSASLESSVKDLFWVRHRILSFL